MQISLLLARQIAILFLMMGCGVLLVRLKLIKPADSRVLSVLIVYIITPCMVLNSFQVDCTPERMRDLELALFASLVFQLFCMLAAKLLQKPLKLCPVERASMIFSNCGNLVIPLVSAIFGAEMIFFTSAFICVSNFTFWTYGRMLISGERGFSFKKIFLNVNVIAVVGGLVLFTTGFRMPDIVNSAISGMSSAIGPVSMLMIGILVGSSDLRRIFTHGRAYLICAFRLLILPALFVLLLWATGLARLPSSTRVMLICLTAAAAPAAASVTQVAQFYDRDCKLASSLNVLSTLLCIFTMPLIAQLYDCLIG